jgi:hypothetical protein
MKSAKAIQQQRNAVAVQGDKPKRFEKLELISKRRETSM